MRNAKGNEIKDQLYRWKKYAKGVESTESALKLRIQISRRGEFNVYNLAKLKSSVLLEFINVDCGRWMVC